MSGFITAKQLSYQNRLAALEDKTSIELNNRINSLEMKVNNLRVMEDYLERKCVDLARQEDSIRERLKELTELADSLQRKESNTYGITDYFEEPWQPEWPYQLTPTDEEIAISLMDLSSVEHLL